MLPRTCPSPHPPRTSKSRHTWCGPYAAAVFMRQHYDAYEVCVSRFAADHRHEQQAHEDGHGGQWHSDDVTLLP